MRNLFAFVGGALLSGALLGVLVLHVPLALLATVAAAIACLAWLVVIVVLPWNLYFQARHLTSELQRSRARGIVVSPAQEAAAVQVARRMWRVSVGLHLASAALLALGSWLSQEPLGSTFAALFLLSTLFRPAVEYYRAVRRQLGDVLHETKYPREDVVKLIADVEAHQRELERLREDQASLTGQLTTLEGASMARATEAHRRLEGVARKFDEALDRLTDNREVISGLKAFLRLVREPTPRPGDEPAR